MIMETIKVIPIILISPTTTSPMVIITRIMTTMKLTRTQLTTRTPHQEEHLRQTEK